MHNEEAYSGCKKLGRGICYMYYSNTAHTVKLQVIDVTQSITAGVIFSLLLASKKNSH